MADVVLSGKVTRIGEGRMVSGKNGQVACLDFDICVSRGGKKRTDLMDNTKQHSNDFYRCTIWGEKALAFHKIMGGQTGRIIQVSGTMLEEAFPKTGDVFIGADNPMYAFISQFGNPSFGITFDQSRNGFWIKGTYAFKTYNVNVEKFTLLDYVQNQQPTGFEGGNNGGCQNQNGFANPGTNNGFNANAGFGSPQPANNGFSQPAGNVNPNAVFAQTNSFGQPAPANNSFGQQAPANNGFTQQQQTNTFGSPASSQANGFGTTPPVQNNNGFTVVDEQAPSNPNIAGFGGTEVPPTTNGFPTPNDANGVSSNIPSPSEFTPDVKEGEPQPF